MIKKERKFDIEDSLIVFAVMIAKIVGSLSNTKVANRLQTIT